MLPTLNRNPLPVSKKRRHNKKSKASPLTTGPISLVWIAAVLIITAVVFAGVGQLEFQMHWDDHEQVVNNSTIKEFSAENLKKMFSDYVIGMYQPLTSLSYALDYQIGGLDAGRFHNTNLLLHLLNVFLVWLLGRKLFGRIDAATALALLFAIHPMQAETVYWISTRSNLLFTAFFIGGLLAYRQYQEQNKKGMYLLALGFMLLSCLSKSMAVTFPLVLLALDYLFGKEKWMRAAIGKIPFFVLSLIFGVVALSYTDSSEIELDAVAGPLERVAFIFYSLNFYIAQAIVPVNLSAAHYFPSGNALPIWYYLSPITLIAAALPGILIKSIRRPYFFGLAFFVVTIALVVLVPGRRTIVSERYVYLPYIGLLFALITLLLHLLKDRQTKPALNIKLLIIAGLLAIPAGAITASRKAIWTNSNTLFIDVIEKYPENYHGYAVLGLFHLSGNNAEAALPFFKSAIERKPDFNEGHYNLGIIYGNHLQQPEQALNAYDRAIEIQPGEAKYFIARATLKGKMKAFDQAEADFQKAIELDTDNARAYENLGVIKADQGDFTAAIAQYSKSLSLDGSSANTYVSRGAAHSYLNQHEEAIADYNRALLLSPQNTQAMFNRGVSEFKLQRIRNACTIWKRASELGNAQASNALNTYCKQQQANQ